MSKKNYYGSKSIRVKQKFVDNLIHQKVINKYLTVYDKLIRSETPIIWKNIPNFTKYEASSDGRIRNTWTYLVLKPQLNNGYYTVKLCGDGEQKEYLVNRLVAMAFLPNPKNLPEVDHIDSDTLNNHVTNLR